MNQTSIVPNNTSTHNPPADNRVCCLYRVSTEQQVDHQGNVADIPMQRLECHDFCKRMGWQIVLEFQEEGISGHKVRAADRDKIQAIKDHAKRKEFDIFLVFMFDRIGRIADETPFVVEWLAKAGIRVWSTKEGEQRFESHTDKLTNYIRFWQADGESEKTSIRTSTRMGQIVESGHFTGGVYPYGYKLVKAGRMNKKGYDLCDLAIDEEESPVVRMIFNLCVEEGRGPQAIANLLNSQHFTNRSGHNWHPASIRGMLRNITYLGILRSGESRSGILTELQIIDQQTFDAAQNIMNQRSNESIRRIPRNIRGDSLLAGNIFCGHCGARLCLSTSSKYQRKADGTDILRVRYVCQTKTRKHEPCSGQTGYTQSKLDAIINDIVHLIFANVKHFSRTELVFAGHRTEMEERRSLVGKVQREYEKAEKDLQGLKSEVIKAVNGGSAFPLDLLSSLVQETEQKCRDLRTNFDTAQAALDDCESSIAEMAAKCDQLISWSEIYDTASIEAKKMIVAQLMERVDVHRDYKLTIKFTITVEQFLKGLAIPA